VGNRLKGFMHQNPGLGMAANQVGITDRVCVVTVSNVKVVMINPVLVEKWGSQVSKQEGCLSFPGVRGDSTRPNKVRVTWLEVINKKTWETVTRDEELKNFDAIVFHHEWEHLEGIRCIDR